LFVYLATNLPARAGAYLWQAGAPKHQNPPKAFLVNCFLLLVEFGVFVIWWHISKALNPTKGI
jgi:hypothetical protein